MSRFTLRITGQFKKDLKRCKRRGLPLDELWVVVSILLEGKALSERYKAHTLSGKRAGQWECHIRPDWLLIWEMDENNLVLLLTNTGSHSDIFE